MLSTLKNPPMETPRSVVAASQVGYQSATQVTHAFAVSCVLERGFESGELASSLSRSLRHLLAYQLFTQLGSRALGRPRADTVSLPLAHPLAWTSRCLHSPAPLPPRFHNPSLRAGSSLVVGASAAVATAVRAVPPIQLELKRAWVVDRERRHRTRIRSTRSDSERE